MSAESFLRGLDLADTAVRAAARRGMGKAGLELMRNAVMGVEKVPHDEGTLRGSGSVFVGNRLLGTSESQGDGHGTPSRDLGVQFGQEEMVGTVGFNTPYAAYLHEHPEFDFTEEGTGGKYLEKKLNAHREKYMGLVAAEVRRIL